MKRIDFKSLLDLLCDCFQTEKQCVDCFIKMRWDGKAKCPHEDCIANEFDVEDSKIYTLKSGKDFKCSCCKKIFSYKTGTIFENSKVTMKKWFKAIYLQLTNKKGVNSLHLQKYLKVWARNCLVYVAKTKAYFNTNFFAISSEGTFEADEAYIGGREKISTKTKEAKNKAIVLSIVNRDSKEAKTIVVPSAKYYDELGDKVMQTVKEGSSFITEESSAYTTLRTFYNHETVNHSIGEYVRNKTHTNRTKRFWSLVKRTINRTHKLISKKHLQRCLREMCFRYNIRGLTDVVRFDLFLSNAKGRLRYPNLVGLA